MVQKPKILQEIVAFDITIFFNQLTKSTISMPLKKLPRKFPIEGFKGEVSSCP